MSDDRVNYNRLITIDSEHIISNQIDMDNSKSVYLVGILDNYAKKLLTIELHLDSEESLRLMEGGRLRVGYWID